MLPPGQDLYRQEQHQANETYGDSQPSLTGDGSSLQALEDSARLLSQEGGVILTHACQPSKSPFIVYSRSGPV